MKSEMRQLHLRNTFDPRHQYDLTNKENEEFLESHMFLKLKRNVKNKGRTVEGGNIHHDFILKEDAS